MEAIHPVVAGHELPLPSKLQIVRMADDGNGIETSENLDMREQELNPLKIVHLTDRPEFVTGKSSQSQVILDIEMKRCSDNFEIVQVKCKVTEEGEEPRDLQRVILEFIQTTEREINIQTAEYEEPKLSYVKEKMRKYLLENSSDTNLTGYFDKENKCIHLVGCLEDFAKVTDMLRDMETEDITEMPWKLEEKELTILKMMKFENDVRGMNKEIQFEYQDTGILFRGFSEDAVTVKMKGVMLLQKCDLLQFPVPELSSAFLQRVEVQQFIQKQLEDKRRTKDCKWRLDQNVLKVTADIKHLAECRNLIDQSIFEDKMTLSEDEINRVLKSRKWLDHVSRMNSQFGQYYILKIDQGRRNLHILCTADFQTEICESMKDFRQRNVMMEKEIKCSSSTVQFFELLRDDQMFKGEFVEMTRIEGGLKVRAPQSGIRLVEQINKQLTGKFYGILNNECIIYLGSEAGKTDMDSIGKARRCLIKLKENLEVEIVKGLIEDQEADVIVNSVSPDLVLEVGQPKVATSIFLKAGPEFQRELKRLYPNGIEEWKIAFCPGEPLKCKEVFNCCLTKPNPEHNKKEFSEMVWNCLDIANRKEYKTIVFPALGTGIAFKYPPRIVADLIFSTISDFIRKTGLLSLRRISIILFPENIHVVQAFENEYNTWCPKEYSADDGNLFIPDASCNHRDSQDEAQSRRDMGHHKNCIYKWQLEVVSGLDDVSEAVGELENKFQQQRDQQRRQSQLEQESTEVKTLF